MYRIIIVLSGEKLFVVFEPVETPNDDRLSTRTATCNGKFFLVRTTSSWRIVELFARSSVLVVKLYTKITSGCDYVSGCPRQRVRRNWMYDNATLEKYCNIFRPTTKIFVVNNTEK